MPKGPPPQWRARNKDWDHLIAASIDAAGAELTYAGVETEDRAQEIKRGLFRSAKAAGRSVSVKIAAAADGTWQLAYKTHSKAEARAYMLAKYGPNPNAWPYNPRRRNTA